MANVKFLRGLQANLPTGNNIQDGAFYLTKDTNRLYVGQDDSGVKTTKLLNQTVEIVSSLSDLTAKTTAWGASADDHINDFYYISGSNILAVYLGTNATGTTSGWKQINPDTNIYITGSSLTATSSSTDNVSLALGLTDSDGTTGLGSSINIVGSGNAHVGVNGNGAITVSADSYSLTSPTVSTSGSTATATITLQNNGNASQNSTLQIKSKNTATLAITKTGDVLEFESIDTSLFGGSVSITANNGTVGVSVTDSDNNTASGSLSNIGVKLNNGSIAPLTTSADVTSDALIYSKSEIDSKLAGLDGMTYKGTVGTAGTVTALPTLGVKNGDVYIVINNGYTGFGASAQFSSDTSSIMGNNNENVRVGDMIIAKGTETLTTVSGVSDYFITSNLEWTYIPSGNDELDFVTYTADGSAATHSIGLVNGNSDTIVKHALVAGTDINLSSVLTSGGNNSNNILTTTITHAAYANVTPAAASTLSNGTTTFTAIKALTLSNGHITGITTDTFTPITYSLENAETENQHSFGANNSGSNDVDITFTLGNSNNDSSLESTGKFNIASSTLKLTANLTSGSTHSFNIDLEWGTF